MLVIDLQHILSSGRYARYSNWAGDSPEYAAWLYQCNVLLSERKYTSLHILEIVLRNRIDEVLSRHFSNEWYNDFTLIKDYRQKENIIKAKEILNKTKRDFNKGHMIAELTLGFWTSFFNKSYENLWQQYLHDIARTADGKKMERKFFSSRLDRIRSLRNRIAHHEPILHLDLHAIHHDTLTLIHAMSPAAHAWTMQHSTFIPALHDHGYSLVGGVA